MSKFTSGQWEAHPNRIIANGHVVAIVNGGNAANERLIAAAPEMYELLKSVTEYQTDRVWDVQYYARQLLARIDGEATNEQHSR